MQLGARNGAKYVPPSLPKTATDTPWVGGLVPGRGLALSLALAFVFALPIALALALAEIGE